MLLAPLVEAFALPIFVERAELQKPHAEYVQIHRQQAFARMLPVVYTYPQGDYCLPYPDEDVKVAKFQQAGY